MNKIGSIVLSIRAKRGNAEIEFFANSSFNFGIYVKNQTEEYYFLTNTYNIFNFSAFLLSSMAGQVKKDFKFIDNNAVFHDLNKDIKEKAVLTIVQGAGSSDINSFYLYKLPAVVGFTVLSENDKDARFNFYTLTAMDVISKTQNLTPSPEVFIIANRIKLIKQGNDIVFRLLNRNSEAVLRDENKNAFVFNLERYLSGQYLSDRIRFNNYMKNKEENQKNNIPQPGWSTRFNRDNLLFSGSVRPRIEINKNRVFLTYYDTAELYFVLKSMTGGN